MISKIKKYGKYIGFTASVLMICAIPAACSKDDVSLPTVSYGPEIGFADGNVDLSAETPVINISDIKSPVGENIDFLSGVTIANEDDFDDLEIWADASLVDIFTPGNYTATYTFNYDGKSVSKSITVTIFQPETEQSASVTENEPANGATGETSTTADGGSFSDTQNTTTGNNSGNSNTTTGNNSGNNSTTTTAPKPTSTQKPSTSTQKPTSTQATSTTRQIITTMGNETTESKNIGNYTIELLSGKTITIRNTTAKYIVSTKTDVSTTTRNGKTYRVSSLIITYNTGATQILETVEERIK